MLPVENLSILENEKVCTLWYIASLKFFAKPQEAIEAVLPAIAPKNSEKAAAISRTEIPPMRMNDAVMLFLHA